MNKKLIQLIMAATVGMVPSFALPMGCGLGQVYVGSKQWRVPA